MKQEIKGKWIAALLSGKYKQGRGELKASVGNTFCCLGVLCDLAAKEGVGKWDKLDLFESPNGQTYCGALPESVQAWAGISWGGGNCSIPEIKTCLIALNDIERLSFEEIAYVIEGML